MPPVLQVVGMGLLLTFIGMQTSKIVVPDAETMVRAPEQLCAHMLLSQDNCVWVWVWVC